MSMVNEISTANIEGLSEVRLSYQFLSETWQAGPDIGVTATDVSLHGTTSLVGDPEINVCIWISPWKSQGKELNKS